MMKKAVGVVVLILLAVLVWFLWDNANQTHQNNLEKEELGQVAPAVNQPGFMGAIKAIENKDYVDARAKLLPLAEQGDRAAQFYMGLLNEQGRGGEANNQAAMEWYRRAAKRNYVPAQFRLGSLFALDHSVENNINATVFWWEKAAQAGHVNAQLKLGLLYTNGPTKVRRPVLGRSWLTEAARRGSLDARMALKKPVTQAPAKTTQQQPK